jgi:uncharacterized protein YeaO (DUF488 family)
MLKHKSVYARTERHRDGLRIHTARTRGRGLPSSKYAVWSSLGPSQKLLSEYRAEKSRGASSAGSTSESFCSTGRLTVAAGLLRTTGRSSHFV